MHLSFRFFLVAPTIQQIRLALWIQRWAKKWKMDVHLQDVTNAYTALDIVGPESRNLLKEVTGEKLVPSDFPSFSYRVSFLKIQIPKLFHGCKRKKSLNCQNWLVRKIDHVNALFIFVGYAYRCRRWLNAINCISYLSGSICFPRSYSSDQCYPLRRTWLDALHTKWGCSKCLRTVNWGRCKTWIKTLRILWYII